MKLSILMVMLPSTTSQHCACTVLACPKNEHEEILWNTLWPLADLSAFIYDHLVNYSLFVLSYFFSSFLIEQDGLSGSSISLTHPQHTGAKMCNGSPIFIYFLSFSQSTMILKEELGCFVCMFFYPEVFYCFLVIFKIVC